MNDFKMEGPFKLPGPLADMLRQRVAEAHPDGTNLRVIEIPIATVIEAAKIAEKMGYPLSSNIAFFRDSGGYRYYFHANAVAPDMWKSMNEPANKEAEAHAAKEMEKMKHILLKHKKSPVEDIIKAIESGEEL